MGPKVKTNPKILSQPNKCRQYVHEHFLYISYLNIIWILHKPIMKRKAPAKPQARSFQFVSLTPELAGDNVAKADQRRLVRSNAATFQWSRQRKGGPKSIALEVENHAGLVGDQVTHDTNLSSKPTGTSPDTASNSSKAWKGESKSKTSSPDINTDQAPGPFAIVGQTDDHVTLVPSPQQYTVVSPMDQAGQQLRFSKYFRRIANCMAFACTFGPLSALMIWHRATHFASYGPELTSWPIRYTLYHTTSCSRN